MMLASARLWWLSYCDVKVSRYSPELGGNFQGVFDLLHKMLHSFLDMM